MASFDEGASSRQIRHFGVSGCVEVQVEDAIATVALNRPQRLNAFDADLISGVTDAAQWLDTQERVKVAVFRGRGRAFSAGFDLKFFADSEPARHVADAVGLGRGMIEAVSQMRSCTVSAVHGHCIGGGVLLCLACDLRYAAADARFRVPETEIGIPLTWGGIPRLVREIGPSRAIEVSLLCREFSAHEAWRMGLVNEVADVGSLDAMVDRVAATLASRSNLVLKTTKQQVLAAIADVAGTAHSSLEASLVQAALTDEESAAVRGQYLSTRQRR